MGPLHGFRTDLRMGWRNLGRNSIRTVLACFAIAIAQITLIWINSFMNGHQARIFEVLTGPMVGHIQIHAPKYRDEESIDRVMGNAASLVSRISGLPHVRAVAPRVYAPVLASLKETGHVAGLTGMDIGVERMAGGVLEGLDMERIPAGREILVGKRLALDMGIRPGDTLALMGQAVDGSVASGLYRVRGIVETPVDQVNQAGIIMDLPQSQDFLAMTDQVHEIVVRATSREAITPMLSALEHIPLLKSCEILSWDRIVPSMASLLKMSGRVNYMILVMVFLTTVAGVVNTMLMATFERSREFGMLLALGCSPARLIRLLAIESLTLGIVGGVVGTVIGVAITLHGVRNGIDLAMLAGSGQGANFVFEGMNLGMKIFPILKLKDVAGGVAAVCVTSVLASLWPARRISRLEPVEAMRS